MKLLCVVSIRDSSGLPLNTIQLSVNFGDITPSYLVFLEYVILIHKKLSEIQVPNPSDNVTRKVIVMSVTECEC